MPLRIAAVNMEPVVGDVVANVAWIATAIRRAADEGADLVVFPETATTGYDPAVFRGALPTLTDASWAQLMRTAVDETGCRAIVGCAIDRGDHRTVSQLVFLPGQPMQVPYDKRHLVTDEAGVFRPGDRSSSLRVGEVTVALSLCADAEQPAHAAAAAAGGASVYVNGGAYFAGGADRLEAVYGARARETGMYVVFAVLAGGPHSFVGGSGAFDPSGRRVAGIDPATGIAIVDVPALETS